MYGVHVLASIIIFLLTLLISLSPIYFMSLLPMMHSGSLYNHPFSFLSHKQIIYQNRLVLEKWIPSFGNGFPENFLSY